MSEPLRWMTCAPRDYPGDERFFSRDTGLLCLGLREAGVECQAVLCGDPRPGDHPALIRASHAELAGQGIQINLALHEKLPQLHLSLQFRSALKKLIEFSRVLLRDGGELTIAARMHGAPESRYLEVKFINAAATSLTIQESEVFRPFLRVNQQQVGLSLAVARQILKHHRATISFRKQPDNCGVFSVLIDVPVRESR